MIFKSQHSTWACCSGFRVRVRVRARVRVRVKVGVRIRVRSFVTP
jgi:hypothetical protein